MINVLLCILAVPCFIYFVIRHVRPQWNGSHKAWWPELAGAVGALLLLVPLVRDFIARQGGIDGPGRVNLHLLAAIALASGFAVHFLGVRKSLGEPKAVAIGMAVVGMAYLALARH